MGHLRGNLLVSCVVCATVFTGKECVFTSGLSIVDIARQHSSMRVSSNHVAQRHLHFTVVCNLITCNLDAVMFWEPSLGLG